MITPTVGRVVWFHPGIGEKLLAFSDQPLAAMVTYVWGDRMVNLVVFDSNGVPAGRTSVKLRQEGDEPCVGEMYCEWMPYQKGQAAKNEALEAKIFMQHSPAV